MTEQSNTHKTDKRERPLSPHLQVYKLPMTAKMSISHRMTGVLLTFGLILLAAWMIAAGLGEETYQTAMSLIDTPVTKFIFLGWAFVLFYHMGNGIRHIFWDMGIGLTESAAKTSGTFVLAFAVLVTAGFWWMTCDCAARADQDQPPQTTIEQNQEEQTDAPQ